MTERSVVYRGSLKSCNYRCSYCPFSKHPMSERELLKDKEQWRRFVGVFTRNQGAGAEAVLVAPYGEAMIHPWYAQGLAALSALPAMRMVGAQTNLSFSIRETLENIFDRAGGIREKLCFWATFHPEMTDTERFAARCGELLSLGVKVSAGAVGAPGNLDILRDLRQKLPEKIYLWINKMDGLGRQYTEEEKTAFSDIDPYFPRELAHASADASKCGGRLFAEGNGRLRTCNISRVLGECWEPEGESLIHPPAPVCGRKLCSCYLAYGGQDDDMNRILFGPYPIFRIPRRAKAVFFDLAGTLLSEKGKITDMTLAGLKGLAGDHIPMFAATTLPYAEAKKRCGGFWELFSGGIFSAGAHVVLRAAGGRKRREHTFYMEEACLDALTKSAAELCCRILTYRNNGRLYKITLLRPRHMRWSEEEEQKARQICEQAAPESVRCFVEENCMEIVAKEADKAAGVEIMCRWLGISPEEAAAAGDSAEDKRMLELCEGRHGNQLP